MVYLVEKRWEINTVSKVKKRRNNTKVKTAVHNYYISIMSALLIFIIGYCVKKQYVYLLILQYSITFKIHEMP